MSRSAVHTLFLSLLLLHCSDSANSSARVPEPDLSTAPEPAVEQAIREARSAVLDDPNSVEPWRHFGALLGRYGWLSEAGACYQAAEGLEPDEFQWPYLRGTVLSGVAPSEAQQALQRALEIDPNYPVAHLRLGDMSIEVDDLEAAEASFRRALELAPANLDARLRLGRLLIDHGSLEEALGLLRGALDDSPDHPEIHEALARACFRAGEKDQAQRHAESARNFARKVYLDDPRARPSLRPISLADHIAAGIGAIRDERREEARAFFERAVEIDPAHREARRNLAICLAQLGQLEDAEREFAELRRRFPTWLEPILHQASLLENLGRLREAFEALSEARLQHPTDAALAGQLGQLLASQRRFPQAVEPLQAAIEHDDTPGRRLVLASVLRQLQRWTEAAEVLEPALAAVPEDLTLRRQLVDCLGRADRTADALEVCRALELGGPDDPTHRALLLQSLRSHAAHLAPSDPAGAVTLYEEALQTKADWSPAVRGLAWLLATSASEEHRDPTRARQLAESLLEDADASALDTLAAACAAEGDFAVAITHAEAAVTKATASGKTELAQHIRSRLEGYRAGRAYVSNEG